MCLWLSLWVSHALRKICSNTTSWFINGKFCHNKDIINKNKIDYLDTKLNWEEWQKVVVNFVMFMICFVILLNWFIFIHFLTSSLDTLRNVLRFRFRCYLHDHWQQFVSFSMWGVTTWPRVTRGQFQPMRKLDLRQLTNHKAGNWSTCPSLLLAIEFGHPGTIATIKEH